MRAKSSVSGVEKTRQPQRLPANTAQINPRMDVSAEIKISFRPSGWCVSKNPSITISGTIPPKLL
jgi:hypothetical protein